MYHDGPLLAFGIPFSSFPSWFRPVGLFRPQGHLSRISLYVLVGRPGMLPGGQ